MALCRVRSVWTGLAGLPGVSTMYFEASGAPPVAAIATFWNAVKGGLPSGLSITVDSVGQTVDPTTGKANGNWSATAPAVTLGVGGGPYAAPTGMYVSWRSGAFIDGREVKGKTFLVPLTASQYDAAGNILDTFVTIVQNAATALVGGASGMTILSRDPGGGAGTATVASAKAIDKAVILRSRRP